MATVGAAVFPVALYAPKALAVLFAAAGIAAAVHLVRTGGWKALGRDRLAWGLSALAAWMAISTAWSAAPIASLRAAAVFAAIGLAGLMLLAAVRGLSDPERERVETGLMVGGAVGVALLALEIVSGGALLAAGTALLGRPVPDAGWRVLSFNAGAAVLAIFAWPLAAAVWQQAGRVAGLGLLAGVAVLLIQVEGGAPVFAFAVGATVFALAAWRMRVARWLVLLGLAGLIAAAPVLALQSPPRDRLAIELPYLFPSAYHRLVIWKVAADLVRERPVVGHGMDASRRVSSPAEASMVIVYDAAGNEVWPSSFEPIPLHPHNAIMQVWLELGAVGALLGAACVLAIAAAAFRGAGPRAALRAGGFAAAVAVALISYGAWQGWWLAALWLAGAFSAGRSESPAEKPS